MLLSPPPAPIIRNEIIRSGVDGLTDADLVIVAHALMAATAPLRTIVSVNLLNACPLV